MSNIRKFVYAALLALTTMNLAPALASAEEVAHGRFTLTHDVHWEGAIIPAGEYHFSLDSDGAPRMLTLSSLSGRRVGFLLMVHDSDDAKPSDRNQLVLQSTPEGSYVSAMELPEFGLTLNFKVPTKAPRMEKQIAKAATAGAAAAR